MFKNQKKSEQNSQQGQIDSSSSEEKQQINPKKLSNQEPKKQRSRSREKDKRQHRKKLDGQYNKRLDDQYNKKSSQKKSQRKQIQSSKQPIIRKLRVNNFALENIIMQHKRTNRRLDQEQLNRAAHNFQQTFKQSIKPVTLSAYLSKQSQKDDKKDLKKKQFKCDLVGCKAIFNSPQQLLQHIQIHKVK